MFMLILLWKKQTDETQRRSQRNMTSESLQRRIEFSVTFLAVRMVGVGHYCTFCLSQTVRQRSSRQDSWQDPAGPLEQQGDTLLCTATLCCLVSKWVSRSVELGILRPWKRGTLLCLPVLWCDGSDSDGDALVVTVMVMLWWWQWRW